jgi:glycosyltransferase involved in cell wall biosynthesis
MSGPAVTVLLPVFNGARHLRESVGSVLAQRFTDFELLVVDDGSTDETPEILASIPDPRLRVVRNDGNIGLVATLNRGLAEARGEWIARQDADDISAPGRLAAQMAFVRGNPSVPVLGTDAWLIAGDGRNCGRWRTGGHADLVAWDLCFRAPFAHASVLFRRSIITERFGGYRDARACEDLELWSRVAAEFPVVTLREPLVKYRLHDGSIMANTATDLKRMDTVKEILKRYMRAVSPGFGLAEAERIAQVWSGGKPESWASYFAAVKELELGFSRGRRTPSGFRRLLAEQYYALFFRERRQRILFLRALAAAEPGILPRMPWVRMLAALVLR